MPAVSPVQRRTPSMLIAVVVLAFLFVGAVAFALFAYMDRENLIATNNNLKKQAEQMGPVPTNVSWVVARKDTPVVETYQKEISDLRGYLGVDPGSSPKDAKTQLVASLGGYLIPPAWDAGAAAGADSLKTDISQTPSVTKVLGKLKEWVEQANKEIDSRQTQKKDDDIEIGKLKKANADLTTEKQTAEANWNAEIKRLDDEKKKDRKDLTANFATLEAKLRDDLKKVDNDNLRLERENRDLRVENDQLKTRNQVLEKDIDDLRHPKPVGGEDPTKGGPSLMVGPTQMIDGKIMKADVARGVVYLDLGENDRVPLGMQFRVYAATEKDLGATNAGKGLIEVTGVSPTLSECRIVEKGTEAIVEGDVVVNPVYRRGQRMKFFVFGGFDLDRDGRVDPRGQDRIKQLVKSWGGEVVDTINVDTDYAIMGVEPELPSKPAIDADPITQQEYLRKKGIYDDYAQKLSNLRKLTIPILNQNRFLSFIGYYQRQDLQ